jgi:alpha-beta hydrolase superfamily lysophospholipase
LDPVGRNGKGVRSLFTYLKSIFPDTNYELVENARHEVFSEKNKELSYGILKTFITKY